MGKLIWIVIIIVLLVGAFFLFRGGDTEDIVQDQIVETDQADTSDIEALSGEELIGGEEVSEDDDVELGELI